MLNEDYKDILSALLAQQAEFILVGAYALAAHGYPRATMDIDIWINPSGQNAKRVYDALGQFGAPLDYFTLEDLSKPGMVFQIGVAPRRIDILTSISGVDFDEAMHDADTIDIDGYLIRVLSTKHLIQNKRATARAQDLADIETLESHNPS